MPSFIFTIIVQYFLILTTAVIYYVGMHACMYVCVCVYVRIYVCIYVCTCVYVCMCICMIVTSQELSNSTSSRFTLLHLPQTLLPVHTTHARTHTHTHVCSCLLSSKAQMANYAD
jgi:hypothetical protein